MSGTETLDTSLSRLEPVSVAHAVEMFPLLCEPAIYEYLSFGPPASLEALTERYQRQALGRSADGTEQWLNWIIRPRDTGACAGFVQATLLASQSGIFGFILGPAYWGRGLAYDACRAALEVLFRDHCVTCLFATADRRNARSLALLTRLGFQRVDRSTYPRGDVLASDDVFRLDHTGG
jgi:RimJ/RimL family protein N-acetyltransferase